MYESAFRSIDDMLWANLGVSISLLLGLLAVFRADLTQSLVSIRAVGREGLSEIKTTYGGFFIGISLYALTAQSSTVFTVIELAKGKSSIEIGGMDQLVPTLELIKQAVEAGELDAQIEVAANKLREGFHK
jgi:hypothetical protein